QVLYLTSAAAYAHRLRQYPGEAEALFKELLIGVTHFFRDPAAFEALTRAAIRPILAGKSQDQEVRFWVPACATGEEAYSLAIIVKDLLTEMDLGLPVR